MADRNSSGAMPFILGGVVVAVAILAYIVFAGGEGGGVEDDSVNVTVEGADSAVEEAGDAVEDAGDAVEDAADAVEDSADN